MSRRYAAGQTALAFVITVAGVLKAVRIFVDWVDDNTTYHMGLK